MSHPRTQLLAAVGMLMAVLVLASCGTDSDDVPEPALVAAPEAAEDSPQGTLERWLAAVRRGDTQTACRLMTRRAHGGFYISTMGLPLSGERPEDLRRRRCPATVRAARRAIPDDLRVGALLPYKHRCEKRLEGRRPARLVEWRSGKAADVHWLCRTPSGGWKVGWRLASADPILD